jgi:tetratricopeptide (TPR) repeat protein
MKWAVVLFGLLFLVPGCSSEPQSSLPDGNAVFDRADHDLQFGDANKAITNFTEAIRIFKATGNPRLGEAYYGRGLAYSRLIMKQQAESDFQEAARLGFTGRRQ